MDTQTGRAEDKTVKIEEQKNTVLKAGDLRDELQGSYEQRMSEEKTMLITLTPGKRPVVIFTGFWNGKLISAATNSIAKAYRLRKHRVSRPTPSKRTENHTPKDSGNGEQVKEKSDVLQKP